nr:MAG TPA: hypothetical protein [Caudoviricetes sp.]
MGVRAVCPVDEVNIRLVACGVSTTNLKKKAPKQNATALTNKRQ